MIEYVLPAINLALHLFQQYGLDLVLLIVSVAYRKELFEALAGGNGHLQGNELAKGLILLMCYSSFRHESLRPSGTSQIFDDAYWFVLLGSVCYLAGIKDNIFSSLFKRGEKKPE